MKVIQEETDVRELEKSIDSFDLAMLKAEISTLFECICSLAPKLLYKIVIDAALPNPLADWHLRINRAKQSLVDYCAISMSID